MNHRVKLKEVTHFADQLHNETMKALDGIVAVRSSIKQIVQMETFQGEAADKSKTYFLELHDAILQEFEELFTSLKRTLDNHIESFQANVDSTDSAIIESYYLKEKITTIEDDFDNLSQVSEKINTIIQSV
ncbi:T7SS effector LXG polymorphic toxin [Bacillus alkalicellulosilyticus]|uniref:T7SS effector LXG polymorphic toxin n=1 Tax=Alkalihalobacterium alkalicellulosilyticum TaxID=1912214 RepID=UPI0014828642|nr:T7SS effector LXG polymorphic toxin [Bacillus alkalicellulosilyticus]